VARACVKAIPWRSHTGASGKATSDGVIRPTPTQMLNGIQL
jgi:hypothetical protein